MGRNTNVATKDVPTKFVREEYVGSMGEGPLSKLVAMMVAPTFLRRKESAGDMEQSTKLVVTMDAPTKHRSEEYVGVMEQSLLAKHAAVRGAQIRSSTEASAIDMGRRSNYAVMTDAPTFLRREECV